MPWNSGTFISGVGDWFSTNDAASEDATAEEIAKFYGIAARTVIPSSPSWASTPITLKSDQIIASGFSTSFKLAKALSTGSYLTVNPSVWLPAATAIVTYWTGVTFLPMPPPPGGLVGATNVITFPGLPTPLNFDIGDAFKQEDAFKAARALNDAMIGHLSSVTGLWTGTAPGAPPPPFALPWVGLK